MACLILGGLAIDQTHIQHHRHSGRRLTEVGHDPESFYCTLLGRLTVGPAIAIAHVAHHTHPHVPWYELPDVWCGMREGKVR